MPVAPFPLGCEPTGSTLQSPDRADLVHCSCLSSPCILRRGLPPSATPPDARPASPSLGRFSQLPTAATFRCFYLPSLRRDLDPLATSNSLLIYLPPELTRQLAVGGLVCYDMYLALLQPVSSRVGPGLVWEYKRASVQQLIVDRLSTPVSLTTERHGWSCGPSRWCSWWGTLLPESPQSWPSAQVVLKPRRPGQARPSQAKPHHRETERVHGWMEPDTRCVVPPHSRIVGDLKECSPELRPVPPPPPPLPLPLHTHTSDTLADTVLERSMSCRLYGEVAEMQRYDCLTQTAQ